MNNMTIGSGIFYSIAALICAGFLAAGLTSIDEVWNEIHKKDERPAVTEEIYKNCVNKIMDVMDDPDNIEIQKKEWLKAHKFCVTITGREKSK